MSRHGLTLIELLIVTAMLAILSAGLLFSTTQITQRAMHSERAMLMEIEMARALSTILADAMQAQGHTGSGEAIAFAGPEGAIDYTFDGGLLTRRWTADGIARESVIAENLTEAEFRPGPSGLTVSLRGEIALRLQVTERSLSTFVAWPAEVAR